MRFQFTNIAFLILFHAAYLTVYAQQGDSIIHEGYAAPIFHRHVKTEIVTGLNFQSGKGNETRRYFELGIARSIHNYGMHGPASAGIYLSEEISFDEKNIYGTKLGAYTHYLFDIGLAIVYYTNFEKGNLKLRPELGLGIGPVRITGGYNIPTFANKAFGELRKNNGQLTIQCLIPVKKQTISKEQSIFKKHLKEE